MSARACYGKTTRKVLAMQRLIGGVGMCRDYGFFLPSRRAEMPLNSSMMMEASNASAKALAPTSGLRSTSQNWRA